MNNIETFNPTLIYTNPEEWESDRYQYSLTLPFYLLITKTFYRIFWTGEEFYYFDFITSKFDKKLELIKSYEIIEYQKRKRKYYDNDRKLIKYILNHPSYAKRLNPAKYLTHQNPLVREVIAEAYENKRAIKTTSDT